MVRAVRAATLLLIGTGISPNVTRPLLQRANLGLIERTRDRVCRERNWRGWGVSKGPFPFALSAGFFHNVTDYACDLMVPVVLVLASTSVESFGAGR